jgi:hypothetical protein
MSLPQNAPGLGDNVGVDVLFRHVGVLDGVVDVVEFDKSLGKGQPVVTDLRVRPPRHAAGSHCSGQHARGQRSDRRLLPSPADARVAGQADVGQRGFEDLRYLLVGVAERNCGQHPQGRSVVARHEQITSVADYVCGGDVADAPQRSALAHVGQCLISVHVFMVAQLRRGRLGLLLLAFVVRVDLLVLKQDPRQAGPALRLLLCPYRWAAR